MRSFLLLMFVATAASADVLAVANRGGSTITLIDPATMAVLGTVGVGLDPHEIAIGPDGYHAYVSNYGGSNGTTLSVVDLETRTRVKDISIAPLLGPHGIVSVAGKIWFSAERSQAVGRYNPATDRVDWTGRTNQDGSHMLAVRSDGSVAYTGNIGSDTASIIPVSGEESVAKKNVGVINAPEGIALSPDGKELWLGSVQFAGMSVIDTATEQVIATVGAGTFAYRMTFSPDGKEVIVPRAGQLAIYDAAQRTLKRSIPLDSNPIAVVLSPDGTIAYTALSPNRVVKIDLATGNILGSVIIAPTPDGLAYAPARRPPPPGKKGTKTRQ